MPSLELSRLRKNKALGDWVGQTTLSLSDFIAPYFVVEGSQVKKTIKSMPGVYHLSVDQLLKDLEKLKGIGAIILFGLPKTKDNSGSQSYRKDGIVQKAIKAVKKNFPQLITISDACLCAYTSHGHCRIIKKGETIDPVASLKILAKIALSQAEAGVDFIAPSAMLDGQVKVIRAVLDRAGFSDTGILAYSAKYASQFYGPFREALDSAPAFGDRKGYQMDFRNSDQALRKIEADINEGADMVMIKPALAYLDIIYRAKQKFNFPIVAYNVSGEYSMIKRSGLSQKDLALEVITAIKRAGADFIITYFAKDLIKWLK